jgi:glucan phosphoethanolaminetransferase (alkaline phosphatase superfamily)
MRAFISIVGIILIILGIIGFSYKYFNYSTNEQVAQIGNVQVTAETEKTVFISPMLSGLAIAAGVVLVIVGVSRRP